MEIKEVEDILIESEKPRKLKFDEKGELIESISIINELEKNKKYTWEKEGIELINNLQNKLSFTNKENYILMQLFMENTIPKKYHPQIWLISSGAKRQMENNKNYYKNLFIDYFKFIPSACENQINKDIIRTFIDPIKAENNELILKLKNILIAYSRRNITVGYCQGFNFIIGELLDFFNENEEEIFWLFSQLIEVILPSDYFINLIGILTDISIIDEILEMKYNLSNNLKLYIKNKINVFLTGLFNGEVNDDTLLAIYDSLFLFGNITIFKTIFFFIDYIIDNDETIEINDKDLSDIYSYNDNLLKNIGFIGVFNLRKILFDYQKEIEFPMSMINKKRIEFKSIILKEMPIPKLKNKKLKINSLINDTENKCDLDWPLCIYDIKYRFSKVDYFVFKTLEKPNLIEDYFFTLNKKEENNKNDNNENLKEIYKNLIIERRQHLCINEGNNKHFLDNVEKIENDTLIQSKLDAENEINNLIVNYEFINKDDINQIIEKATKEKNFL